MGEKKGNEKVKEFNCFEQLNPRTFSFFNGCMDPLNFFDFFFFPLPNLKSKHNIKGVKI